MPWWRQPGVLTAEPSRISGLRSLLVAAGALATGLAWAAGSIVGYLGGPVDHRLASIPQASTAETLALVCLLGLLIVAVAMPRMARGWLRDTRAALTAAMELGAIRRTDDSRDWRRYVAPVARTVPISWYDESLPGRTRSTLVTGLAMAIGIGAIMVGAVLAVVAPDRATALAGWRLGAAGALVLVPALAATWWLVGEIDRRRLLARSIVQPELGAVGGPAESRRAIIGMAVLAVLAAVSIGGQADARPQGVRCLATGLECRWLTVPVDHQAAAARGPVTTVAYGIHRATSGTARGTFVIATGGPGVAGLPWWDIDYALLDEAILAQYDVVAFDARAVGQSAPVDCVRAATTYDATITLDADPSVITTFVEACLQEAGVPAGDLVRYGGDQLVEDIEAIRRDLGTDRIVLYGESYGTAIAQRYAVAHPDRLQALILDGVLDVAQDTDVTWAEAAAGFEATLDRTFAWCRDDLDCAEALDDPAATWDRLMRRLDTSPLTASFAGPDGRLADWPITRAGAHFALSDALYWEGGRALLLRSIEAADRGDWVPLGRLIHVGGGPASSSDASTFGYYATWCADRIDIDAPYDPAAYLAWVRELDTGPADRMRDVALAGAPCSAWPAPADEPIPATLPTGPDVPVIVLTSTGDPITPAATGRRLVQRWSSTADVYLIETSDGPHVTFARGDSCVDQPIVDLLIKRTTPSRRTSCTGLVAYQFTAAPRAEDGDDDLASRAFLLDDELYFHPDYQSWPGVGSVALGCRHGGRAVITPTATADTIELVDCEVVPGEPLTGTGEYGSDGSTTFDVSFADGRWALDLDTTGRGELRGEWRGRTVEETF